MAQNTIPAPPFPPIPDGWNAESRQFALGLRGALERMNARVWQRAYPVGIIILTAEDEKPFTFGEWESVTAVSGLYGWKRVR